MWRALQLCFLFLQLTVTKKLLLSSERNLLTVTKKLVLFPERNLLTVTKKPVIAPERNLLTVTKKPLLSSERNLLTVTKKLVLFPKRNLLTVSKRKLFLKLYCHKETTAILREKPTDSHKEASAIPREKPTDSHKETSDSPREKPTDKQNGYPSKKVTGIIIGCFVGLFLSFIIFALITTLRKKKVHSYSFDLSSKSPEESGIPLNDVTA
ncbi:uncharacterized protein [Ranitomeya imitator]|uniref:uncharacterized protein isoform X7 n=1 Tax=Ranitomeya imitator TaxID=111125 RepID=UPI0037E73D6F